MLLLSPLLLALAWTRAYGLSQLPLGNAGRGSDFVTTGGNGDANARALRDMVQRDVETTRTVKFTPTNYSVVQDYFLQSIPGFNSSGFDPLNSSFGLIDRSPSRWHAFRESVRRLDQEPDGHTAYKVFYLARHGEGWHNVGERVHGSQEWDAYWSMLNGDGNITWGPDPLLTPLGITQAERNAAAWREEAQHGVPLPQSLYSSPLSRAMSTLEITWKELLFETVVPLVKENLREVFGVHTCDKRREKSYIHRAYPDFSFEIPLSEHDQLWSPDWRESDRQATFRLQQTLNKIFATDSATYISITAHGGAISAFLRACGHPNAATIGLQTGSIVPVVVKAVNYQDETNELLAGGQSIAAPPRPRPTAARAPF